MPADKLYVVTGGAGFIGSNIAAALAARGERVVVVDRLALTGGNAATGFSVAGGKYLTDNVYVEVSGGARTGASAQVEYRVTRNLSLVSKLNDQIVTQAGQVVQGGDELSIRWRHDFTGKAKTAKPKRLEPSTPLPAQPQAGGGLPASSPQSLPH